MRGVSLPVCRRIPPADPFRFVHVFRVCQDRKEVPEAEKLYIRGQSAELAVRMYMDLQRWEDAQRVAKGFSPHMIREVNVAWANAMSSDASTSVKQSADIWVESGEYNKAIDAYLKANQSNTDSMDELKSCWLQAFRLATIHLRERMYEVLLISISLICVCLLRLSLSACVSK